MMKRQRRGLQMMLVSGVLLLLLAVISIPTIWALVISFFRYTLSPERSFIGLANYSSSIQDGLFWNAFRNNFIFVFAAVTLELLAGFWIAILLSRGFRGQKLWVSLILAPYAISPVVSVVVWKYMFNTTYGIINYILSFFRMQPINWLGNPIFAFISAVLIDVWKESPFITIILYAAITTIPVELFESAQMDGASPWKRLSHITIPIVMPAILVALTFRTIFVFRTFDIPWILTRGGPANSTELLSIHLYQHGFVYWNFGKAAAIGIIMLIITLLLSFVYIRMVQRGKS